MSNHAIYKPAGKAAEYSKFACNFYTGCSNDCSYCYCKRGVMSHVWSNAPRLKKCFKDEAHALEVFEKELKANLPELQKSGLFFSFTTDPMLPETIELTDIATDIATGWSVPVIILTKRADWVDSLLPKMPLNFRDMYAFGFTLTGHDELEPNASTNQERIAAMKRLHDAGFKTWASIEPIIDFQSAKNVINASIDFCDLYKVGLMSCKKYDVVEAQTFVEWLNELEKPKIYLKDSLQKLSRYTNEELDKYFVNRNYNIFDQK